MSDKISVKKGNGLLPCPCNVFIRYNYIDQLSSINLLKVYKRKYPVDCSGRH